VVVMLALPAGAFAQVETPPAQLPAQTQIPAPTASPAPAPPEAVAPAPVVEPPQTTSPAPRQVRMAPENRRHSVRMMEAVLSRAVLGGAEQLAEQLGNGSPNVSFFTGQARAHGFVLDGYGVFFHVEIPEMQQSLVMSVTTLDRDVAVAGQLDSLRRAVGSVPEGASKLQAEEALKSLELLVGPMPGLADPAGAAGRNMIRTAESRSVSDISPVPMPVLRDPSGAYREAIKAALIDAMLDHSRGMNIQPDEWLTVAAHRGESPFGPAEIVNSSTLVLSVKGSDLALYEADRTRKDEVRKRVETREF
jgi:predicted RecB family endonuclease